MANEMKNRRFKLFSLTRMWRFGLDKIGFGGAEGSDGVVQE